jgi:hypothetical protein
MPRQDVTTVETIPLAEMVESLRNELAKSRERARGEPLQFSVERIELELNVEVSRDMKGDGKIVFGVFSVGASASKSSSSTHTFRLTLIPVSSDGADTRISGETDVRPE